MSEMSPRERVRLALDHQEPDRVPLALGGGPYGVVDDLYFKLIEYLDIGNPVAPFRRGHTISYLDDRLLKRLSIDTRYVWPATSPSSPTSPTEAPNIFLDGFGQPWQRSLPYYYPMKGILSEASSDHIDELVKWPDPTKPFWTAGVADRARMLRENSDYYVIARMVTSHGPFTTACGLRGTEQYMVDMALNHEFAHRLMDRVTDAIEGLLLGYLMACGKYIDMIELPGDDYASNVNLIVSPRMFKEYIKPALKRLVNVVKEYDSNIKVMLHSDGLVEDLLPEFIDLGVDAIHPLEPVEALDQVKIKDKYGKDLSFVGGIDISHVMPGSLKGVVKEVKLRIEQLAPGGGYILAPSNHLQADVPPENVVKLYKAATEFGSYPIRFG